MNAVAGAINADTRTRVIETLLQHLHDHYIFPAVADEMDAALHTHLAAGTYDTVTEGTALAEVLTEHLRAVCHDKHLRVFYSAEPQPIQEPRAPTPDEVESWREVMSLENFGFARAERLPGNIGYLDLHGFFPTELAGDTAVAAMNLLAHTSALIVDLRKNGGGSPAMVALLSSYLFDEATHLNSLYWRRDERTDQFWTLPYVPGKRFGTRKPVYVLTSSYTFSGAEEFTYNLKNLKRATIVGEVTGGGANPGGPASIDEHFGVWIPAGRAINPITQTNWEGTGVTPDIEVPADEALKVAHRAALEAVLTELGEHPTGPRTALAEEAKTALDALASAGV